MVNYYINLILEYIKLFICGAGRHFFRGGGSFGGDEQNIKVLHTEVCYAIDYRHMHDTAVHASNFSPHLLPYLRHFYINGK